MKLNGIPIPCWDLNDIEVKSAINKGKPFKDSINNYFFWFQERIDEKCIIGNLAHSSNKHLPIEELRENSSLVFIREFLKREDVYFTFDNVTLYKLINVMSSSPLNFLLERVDNPPKTNRNTAFMIMPFKYKGLNEFYNKRIKQFLLDELEIRVLRADDFNGNDIIVDTIYNQIEKSEIIIADTTKCNKNVFYEIGWAVAKGKEIITIQDEKLDKQLYFDRAHIRAIFYSKSQINQFQERLKNDIIAIRDKASRI